MKCPKCQTDNPDTLKFCGECGTQLPLIEETSASTETLEAPKEKLARGSTFAGRYQIIEELGKGGMGRVYKAMDNEINEEVAIKLIKPEIAEDEKTIERFRNELKFARKIAHKNVCKMYHLAKEEETPYITMEYVEGEDLKSLVRRKGKIPEEESIYMAKQMGEGLAEAHRLGVVHRDLKPRNIIIDKEGNAKIMDFGIARSVEAPGVTQTGVMIGTPDYISPEQAEGEEADPRSDIYALGVILYELVTGRVPFKGDTALSVALKHKTQIPQDPRMLNPELSENLDRLILKCMEKDKERRYQNTEELLSDLRNLEKGLPLGLPEGKPFAVAFKKKVFIPALVVISLAIISVIIWQLLPQKEAVSLPPGKPSIAVLPFNDMSPQKDQEYFCDGMADSIINALTHIKDFQVVARTSAFSFKGKEQDVREIGKKLNVNQVLEGSVQKADDRIRITAQLINVEDGYHLWSERFDRELKDVFAIQDEISLAIADKLKPKLLGEEKARLVKRHTENLEAYNLYLKGLYFWNKLTQEGMAKGMDYFKQAIEKDPLYALPYVGIAEAFGKLGGFGFLPPKEVFPKAKAAARKALEIDDMLGEAYSTLGYISTQHDWDWLAAEREFKRALDLNPNYALAHNCYSIYLMVMGRFDEAITESKRALEIDPLSPFFNSILGAIFIIAHKYDEAIGQFHKTIEMDPNFLWARIWLGLAYKEKAMFEEAIAELQRVVNIAGDIPYALGFLGFTYGSSGQTDEALKILNRLNKLSKERYIPAISKAWICLGLGDNDQVFKYLEEAYLERESYLIYLNTYPGYDNLRSDPRFGALLKKIGFKK
jgi:serine/threonine protein kinase/lipoprotein NlpI